MQVVILNSSKTRVIRDQNNMLLVNHAFALNTHRFRHFRRFHGG